MKFRNFLKAMPLIAVAPGVVAKLASATPGHRVRYDHCRQLIWIDGIRYTKEQLVFARTAEHKRAARIFRESV